nr:hypothetical protein [Sinorhizobium psoraleae]
MAASSGGDFVAVQTGSDDVLLGIAPSVTSSHQMLCSALEEKDSPGWYPKAFAEDFWIGLPHGLLAIEALPALALGCLASEFLYA